MFAKLSVTFTFASLVLLAAATPNGKRWNTTPTPTQTKTVTVTAPASTPTDSSSCDTGPIQCCASTPSAGSAEGAAILGLLGLVVQGVDVLLGLGCSPISVIGVGGGECDSNVVCCEDNAVGGLISIGCLPVSL
ncbi:Fruiting body protein SC3 [Trametes pubescens]|uniref:Hydrophobin n=1 Tax=Trametes pubescens TaxID=154538 RepID=A0A1M2VHU9_TRAPU|nr:Fruiting body protein SC3 [Trametes pubescens]